MAIVRDKLEQSRRDHERDLERIQKENAEEREKIQAELAAIKAERDRERTEKKFIEQERDDILRRERAARSKSIKPLIQDRATVDVETRNKSFASYMDGFDQQEVPLVSPTRPGTSTRSGVKRKRPANESPVKAAGLNQPMDAGVLIEPMDSDMSMEPLEMALPVIDDMVLEKMFFQDDPVDVGHSPSVLWA